MPDAFLNLKMQKKLFSTEVVGEVATLSHTRWAAGSLAAG